MKKKILALVLACVMSTSIGVYGADTEDAVFEVSDNPDGICTGVYVAGTDIIPGSYVFESDDYCTRIHVFKSLDEYYSYFRGYVNVSVSGDEKQLSNQFAIVDEYVYDDDQIAINLSDGNVLMVDGFGKIINDSLDKKDVVDEQKEFYDGYYGPGTLENGTYIISDSDDYVFVTEFENESSYEDYNSEEIFSVGDRLAATYNHGYIYNDDKTCCISITDDTALYVQGADDCTITKIEKTWIP